MPAAPESVVFETSTEPPAEEPPAEDDEAVTLEELGALARSGKLLSICSLYTHTRNNCDSSSFSSVSVSVVEMPAAAESVEPPAEDDALAGFDTPTEDEERPADQMKATASPRFASKFARSLRSSQENEATASPRFASKFARSLRSSQENRNDSDDSNDGETLLAGLDTPTADQIASKFARSLRSSQENRNDSDDSNDGETLLAGFRDETDNIPRSDDNNSVGEVDAAAAESEEAGAAAAAESEETEEAGSDETNVCRILDKNLCKLLCFSAVMM
jgi:hypothetical protein